MSFPVLLPEHYQILATKLRINSSDIEEQFIRGSGKEDKRLIKLLAQYY